MGIVNVTPDSFSDGGRYMGLRSALAHAHQLVSDGADVLDFGAESTRPGGTPIPWEIEWARLEPVLREWVPKSPIPSSVDTYHPETAERAVALGVDIINDVSACADAGMLECLKSTDVAYVFMHNQPTVHPELAVSDFVADMERKIEELRQAGIGADRIWIDPGVGFAKTPTQNLRCISELDKFVEMGYPVLLGTSRKRVIGQVLDLPVGERLEGTLATVAYGTLKGARMVRVHDVKETVRLCRMLEAIQRA